MMPLFSLALNLQTGLAGMFSGSASLTLDFCVAQLRREDTDMSILMNTAWIRVFISVLCANPSPVIK